MIKKKKKKRGGGGEFKKWKKFVNECKGKVKGLTRQKIDRAIVVPIHTDIWVWSSAPCVHRSQKTGDKSYTEPEYCVFDNMIKWGFFYIRTELNFI